MTVVQRISTLAAAVMPAAVADIAALYPSAPALTWDVSSREAGRYGSAPRAVWVPTRDGFDGPQKITRGGESAQHSIATRVAGVRVELWGADPDQTEDLIECVVRAILRGGGPSRVGVAIVSGQWIEQPGENATGEGYALALTLPIDIRASRTPDQTAAGVTVAIGSHTIRHP